MTSDGLELQGLFFSPDSGYSRATVIHIHGLSGNFYENRFVDVEAEAVVGQGMNFMPFNNRGHEYISDSIWHPEGADEPSYKQIGGMYEMFEESILDVQACIDFARSKGAERIILQGHSHGALKVNLYLSRNPQPDIAGLILLSPSDDFGRQRERVGNQFDEIMERAMKLVADGRERESMPVNDFAYPISAGSYVDNFRPDSPCQMFNFTETDRTEFPELGAVTVPVLGIVGTVEEAFADDPDTYIAKMKHHLANAGPFTGYAIEGAPHNYLQYESELAGLIGDWLGGL